MALSLYGRDFVYLPEVRRLAGASWGALTKVRAAKAACPASVAGKACCACADTAVISRVRVKSDACFMVGGFPKVTLQSRNRR